MDGSATRSAQLRRDRGMVVHCRQRVVPVHVGVSPGLGADHVRRRSHVADRPVGRPGRVGDRATGRPPLVVGVRSGQWGRAFHQLRRLL